MIHDAIPPNQQRIKGHRWPVVGEKTPRASEAAWSVTIKGAVRQSVRYGIDELQTMPQTERVIDIHCVTRWTKLGMRFEGVRLAEIIGVGRETPLWKDDAKYLSFVARSDRSHSTSLPLEEVIELDPLIAFRANGVPLPSEHGGPIRMVVPGKYFYKSIKWLESIEFLSRDRLGYWEAEAGYHNGADPWLQQRYIATQVGKQAVARLVERRDVSSLDLLGLQARGLNLEQLIATGAMLRNADLRETKLRSANFDGANLSNAQFNGADLREACFRNADLEGADFSNADLRGTDFRGGSLFGASFCRTDRSGNRSHLATVDSSTQFSRESLEALTIEQRHFVENCNQ